MLKNILDLDGVKLLNKREQSDIAGGSQTCHFSITRADGVVLNLSFADFSDGQAGSNEANDLCVGVMMSEMNNQRCGYDCEWDN